MFKFSLALVGVMSNTSLKGHAFFAISFSCLVFFFFSIYILNTTLFWLKRTNDLFINCAVNTSQTNNG